MESCYLCGIMVGHVCNLLTGWSWDEAWDDDSLWQIVETSLDEHFNILLRSAQELLLQQLANCFFLDDGSGGIGHGMKKRRHEDYLWRLLVRRTWIKKRRESWLSQDSDLKSGQDWLSQDFTLKSWIQSSRLNFSGIDGSDFFWCMEYKNEKMRILVVEGKVYRN